MRIYNYSKDTFEFTNEEFAEKSPLEENVFFIPAFATDIIPPECHDNQIAVFENGAWNIKNDYRKQLQVELSTKNVSIIDYIGDVKEGFQLVTSDIAEDIIKNPDKYAVINNILTDTSNTAEYKEKMIAIKENEWKKQFIQTSLGWLRINTSMGDLLSLLNSYEIIARLQKKLESETLLFYSTPDFSVELDENYLKSLQYWNSEMSYEEFMSLFSEVSQAYLSKFKGVQK